MPSGTTRFESRSLCSSARLTGPRRPRRPRSTSPTTARTSTLASTRTIPIRASCERIEPTATGRLLTICSRSTSTRFSISSARTSSRSTGMACRVTRSSTREGLEAVASAAAAGVHQAGVWCSTRRLLLECSVRRRRSARRGQVHGGDGHSVQEPSLPPARRRHPAPVGVLDRQELSRQEQDRCLVTRVS